MNGGANCIHVRDHPKRVEKNHMLAILVASSGITHSWVKYPHTLALATSPMAASLPPLNWSRYCLQKDQEIDDMIDQGILMYRYGQNRKLFSQQSNALLNQSKI